MAPPPGRGGMGVPMGPGVPTAQPRPVPMPPGGIPAPTPLPDAGSGGGRPGGIPGMGPGGIPIPANAGGGPGGGIPNDVISPEDARRVRNEEFTGSGQGREQLFSQFLNTNPNYHDISPLMRSILRDRQGQAEASFALQQLQGGQEGGNFRSFLDNMGVGGLLNMDIGQQFQSMLGGGGAGGMGMGGLPGQGQSLSDFANSGPMNAIRAGLLGDESRDGYVQNLIQQLMQGQVNPGLRGYADQNYYNQASRLESQDPTTPMIMQFLQGLYGNNPYGGGR